MKSFSKWTEGMQRSVLGRVWLVHQRSLMAVLAFCVVANLLMLVPTVYMLQVFDRVMVSRSELTLLVISLIALYLFGILALTEWSRQRVLARVSAAFDSQFSELTFQSVFQANLDNTQGSAAKAFGDLNELRQFMSGPGVAVLLDVPWAPIYILVLFLMHPALAALAIVFVCVQAAFAKWGQTQALLPAKQAAIAQAEETDYLLNYVKSAEVIEVLGVVPQLQTRWQAKREVNQTRQGVSQQLAHSLTSTSKFIRYLQQSLTLAVGAALVIRGELSPGAMIAANVLTSRALAPIDGLVGTWRSLLSAKDAYLRLDSTLSESSPFVAVLPKENWQADVLVSHASIKVDGRDLPILQDVQFHAPAGSTTVVMGASGSGKSTLSRVLLGIQAVTDGVVLFDGVDIGHWPKSLLGPHLGYLPQTVDLLEGTVAANIARFGEIDSVKVVEAAKATGLHELILRLPHGYETDVGESGRFLSGGFRQRIALCRAIYGSPKLVVLDEPNANLDDAGEKALVQVLTHLKQQACTVVLITHRSQYLALADRVLVLDRGVVQASGPKDGVLAALSQRKN